MSFNRFLTAALAVISVAQAGQIQIGGANGLTADYIAHPNTITSNNSQGCANAASGGCIDPVSGNANAYQERNYLSALFPGATITNGTSNGSPTAVPNQGATTAASSLTDPNNLGGVTFNMLNDTSVSAGGMNIWASSAASGAQSITIPIGVLAVDKVWIMLNDVWGWAGENPATIAFNFGTSSNVVTSTDTATLSNAANGPLRASLHCTSGTNCSGSQPTTLNGNQIVSGGVLTSPVTDAGVIADATVTDSTIWSGDYTANSIRYANTAGKAELDDLGFNFATSSNLNKWLVSITITSSTDNSNQNSRLALSAITVDTIAPEPSAFILFGTGAALLGFMVRRKKTAIS